MKCNPLRWLWGVLPLTLVWWVGVLANQPRVEEDLAQRANEHLARNNLGWANVVFKGRDGSILGRAEEESDQRRPATEVAKVWGVRSLEDRIEVLQLIKNYAWHAATRDNALALTGHVPNEAARKAIVAAARSAFPKHQIDDKMELARGAPDQKVFLGGTAFALRQLAALKPGGRASLEGAAFAVEGEADSSKSYESVRSAIGSGLPQGVSLKSERIIPPAIKPYTWAAALRGRQIELSGHAPSVAARDQIKAAAERALPGGTVVDRMVLASGAPAEWQKVATSAVARLGQLKQGNAELTDNKLSLTGMTETEETAEIVRKALKADVPGSFNLTEQIRQDPAAKAAEEARRAADEAQREAARRAAMDADARRSAESKAAADAKAKADEDARRAAEAKSAADAAARRAAAEADAQRQAEARRDVEQQQKLDAEAKARGRVADAQRCQQSLTTAAEGGTITFQRASAELDRRSHQTLDQLAQIAKTCPGFAIEVGGHTDSEGEPDRKLRLSERRAKSVLDYLVKAGVPTATLHAAGYGDAKPKVPNDSAENMAKNRRIEFNVKAK